MNKFSIAHTATDQNWADEQTIEWFDVDGTTYGYSVRAGEHQLLDNEGYPMDECNQPPGLFDALAMAVTKVNPELL